jgi:heptose I phosphotransferase
MILNLPREIYANFNPKTIVSDLMQYKGECYRAQKGRTTQRITLVGEDYFIKQHQGVGLLEILKSLFNFRAPILGAKNEWRALEQCKIAGVPTADLIGYGAQGLNPLHQQSFVLTRTLTDTKSLEELCEDWTTKAPEFRYKRQIIKQVALITRQFHQAGMNHRDLYLCHFLLDLKKKDSVHLYLIDLHRTQIHKKISRRDLIKDLSSLLYSSFNYRFSTKDYFYFLKNYTDVPLREYIHKKTTKAILEKAIDLYVKDYGLDPILPELFSHEENPIHKLNPSLNAPFKPYHLLLANGTELAVQANLRVIPNKRWVVKANWQGKSVVAKIFTDQNKYQQELAGIALCNQAKISIPALLHQDYIKKENVWVIILEYIKHKPDGMEKDNLEDLVRLVAKHHDKNITQKDMHINNFIKKNNRIITLDAGSIIHGHHDKYGDNLALLLAQFDTLSLESQDYYFQLYHKARKLSYMPNDLQNFIQKVEYIKSKIKALKIKKLFRTCSEVTCWKSIRQTILLKNSAFSPKRCFFLHHIAQLYPQADDYGCHIAIDSAWIWQPSFAARLWVETNFQENAKPIALIEQRKFLRKTAYFITDKT